MRAGEKRDTIGSILIIFGIFFLLTGVLAGEEVFAPNFGVIGFGAFLSILGLLLVKGKL